MTIGTNYRNGLPAIKGVALSLSLFIVGLHFEGIV